ncbi:T9SS type A sorting domain-containing protein [bacterium SCSIO 12741]|nr:T9SS type A sorting domain-containing protein [bacterium SCSIO 12741]
MYLRLVVLLALFSFSFAALAQSFGPEELISDLTPNGNNIQVADLDGDSDLDVIVALNTFSNSRVVWFKNDGQGNFDSAQTAFSGINRPYSLAVGDIDGDQDLDLLTGSSISDELVWFANDGSGNFGSKKTITRGQRSIQFVYLTDIDQDMDLDVMASSILDRKIALYINQGQGQFSSENRIDSVFPHQPRFIATADIDGDNDLDVIATTIRSGTHRIYSYENHGNLTFANKTEIYSGKEITVLHAEDLDADGDPDIVFADAQEKSLVWLINDGNGSFGSKQLLHGNAGEYVRGLTIADVDGDGDLDLLSASANEGLIAWYEQQNAMAFHQHVIHQSGQGANGIQYGDLNGDGKNDVVVSWWEDRKATWYPQVEPALFLEELSTINSPIFPNPTRNTLRVQPDQLGQPYQVIGLSGQVLMEGTLESQLDVSSLQPGTYGLVINGKYFPWVKE